MTRVLSLVASALIFAESWHATPYVTVPPTGNEPGPVLHMPYRLTHRAALADLQCARTHEPTVNGYSGFMPPEAVSLRYALPEDPGLPARLGVVSIVVHVGEPWAEPEHSMTEVNGMQCFDVEGRALYAEAYPADGVSSFTVSWGPESEGWVTRGWGAPNGSAYHAWVPVDLESNPTEPHWLCIHGNAMVMVEDSTELVSPSAE